MHLVEHVPSQRAGLIMPTEVERLSVSSSHTHKKNEKEEGGRGKKKNQTSDGTSRVSADVAAAHH